MVFILYVRAPLFDFWGAVMLVQDLMEPKPIVELHTF